MLGYVYITKDEKKDPRNEPRKRPLLPKKMFSHEVLSWHGASILRQQYCCKVHQDKTHLKHFLLHFI